MIYINSKGERENLSEINDFHLNAAIQKVINTRNSFVGFANKANVQTEFADTVVRYLDIVRENLSKESEGRESDQIHELLTSALGGIDDHTLEAIKKLIKDNFVLKNESKTN